LTNFDEAVTGPSYRHIDVATQDFIKEEIHKETNGYNGASSWFDISAKLNSLTEFADGDQYLTWKRQGFITLFDFVTVSLRSSIIVLRYFIFSHFHCRKKLQMHHRT
jgi:hypothetical protein